MNGMAAAQRPHERAYDTHASPSSPSSSHLAPREAWAGAGWRPPTEQQKRPSSSWIGGGAIGGVPERNRPSTPEELSALGKDVWRKAGGYRPAAGPGVNIAGGSGSGSGSSSSSPPPSSIPPSWLSSSSSSEINATLLASAAASDPNAYDLSRNRAFVCRSLSECEPCPPQARGHPFCRPYGNRRLVACRAAFDEGGVTLGGGGIGRGKREDAELEGGGKEWVTAMETGLYDGHDAEGLNSLAARAGGSTAPPHGSLPPVPGDVDLLGWEACGKVVRNETRDYLEFVMILVLLALFALQMLIRRNRYLVEKMHFEGGMSPSVDSAGGGTMDAAAGGSGSSSRLRGGAGSGDARRNRRIVATTSGGGGGGGKGGGRRGR